MTIVEIRQLVESGDLIPTWPARCQRAGAIAEYPGRRVLQRFGAVAAEGNERGLAFVELQLKAVAAECDGAVEHRQIEAVANVIRRIRHIAAIALAQHSCIVGATDTESPNRRAQFIRCRILLADGAGGRTQTAFDERRKAAAIGVDGRCRRRRVHRGRQLEFVDAKAAARAQRDAGAVGHQQLCACLGAGNHRVALVDRIALLQGRLVLRPVLHGHGWRHKDRLASGGTGAVGERERGQRRERKHRE